MTVKLEDRSWRTLAVKLSDLIQKAQQGLIEPKYVDKYIEAIHHKLNIENGYYIENGRSNPPTDATG